MKTVLIVDDEVAIRETLAQILAYEKYRPRLAPDGPSALALVAAEKVDVVLLDIKMPGMDGFEVLERLLADRPGLPVIVVSGHGNIETAVEAVKKGAYDFLEKPLDRSRLLVTLRNCLDHQRAIADRRILAEQRAAEPLVGECPAMRHVRSLIERVAPTDTTVLVTGENGTGKELVVRAIHRRSRRCERPLVEVNCAAIPRDLVESELFGHEKGAFTGADRQRIGKFDQADGGTLFLDEIGDMSEEAQAKVLKAIEESRFQRVGGSDIREVDVRIVAATNRDLARPESGFRQDLFFRLNVIPIHLPPLRDRGSDVDLLLDHFVQTLSARLKIAPRTLAPEARALLREHTWPGNVRELRNLVERLLILAPGPVIAPADLPPLTGRLTDVAIEADLLDCEDFQDFKARAEGLYLQHKLQQNRYNVSKTAETLGMQRSNLYKKITKYGLRTQPEDPGSPSEAT
ncbi:MAG: sigma-54 dependent transcriptional regulator [Candidatus Krumholzibacteriia bacterium]